MLERSFIRLIAINPKRNVSRVYEIAVGQDLFGQVSVTIRRGRLGGAVTTEIHAVADDVAAEILVRERVKRRRGARRRIGTAYRPVEGSAELMAKAVAWLG